MGQLAGAESVDVAASAAEVWAYRLDFTNLPEYNPQVSALTRVREGDGNGGILGPGATYEFTLIVEGAGHRVSLRVTEASEGTSISADMSGQMNASETFVVEALGPTSCRATLTLFVDLPDGLDEKVTARLLEHGRADIRGELDLIHQVFERRGAR